MPLVQRQTLGERVEFLAPQLAKQNDGYVRSPKVILSSINNARLADLGYGVLHKPHIGPSPGGKNTFLGGDRFGLFYRHLAG